MALSLRADTVVKLPLYSRLLLERTGYIVALNEFTFGYLFFLILKVGASLVAQWLRICLLMQGTRVQALVREDPTCHGAAGPVSHNY